MYFFKHSMHMINLKTVICHLRKKGTNMSGEAALAKLS